NRRKNGDHYWVMANATPVMSDGKVVGYMSVRTKPTREQVQAAERLYARMRAERAQGRSTVTLHRGRTVATGWRGAVQRATRLTLGRSIGLVSLGLALGGLLVGELGARLGTAVHIALAV